MRTAYNVNICGLSVMWLVRIYASSRDRVEELGDLQTSGTFRNPRCACGAFCPPGRTVWELRLKRVTTLLYDIAG
jgi:hypothetical protein